MKKVIILLLLFVFTFSTFAQPPRRVGPRTIKGPPPAPEVKTVSLEDPLNTFAVKGALPKEHIFAAVSSAKTAADMIIEGDENSLSALIGALMFTGFHIIDRNQKILFAPRWGANGMAFYDFEIVGMLRFSQVGMASSISQFGNKLAGDNEDVKRLNLSKQIFDKLQAARNSKDYENKFFAELIFALSNNKSLVSAETPISVLQLMLIERRFLGDLIDMYSEIEQGNLFRHQNEIRFANASYSSVKAFNASADSPCKELEDVSKVTGYEGKIKKVGKLFGLEGGKDPLDSPLVPNPTTGMPSTSTVKKAFKQIAEQIELVNTIMSYLNLILANITISADFDVPEKLPYVRTKSGSRDGEFEKILTLTLKRKKMNAEAVNCAGKAVKMLSGLDISIPDDGPVKDVPVAWEDIDTSNKVKDSREYPVQIQAVPDRFKAIDNLLTDDKGESKIKLIGNRQLKDLTNVGVFEYIRPLRLKVRIATEKMDAEKDLSKIFWEAIDIKSGGIAGFIIEMIPEMASKMKLIDFQKIIPIKDWKPCTDDDNWGGSVTYMREKNSPNFSLSEDAIITIVAKPEGEPTTGIPEAFYEVRGSRERKNPIQVAKDECCTGEYKSQGGSSMEFSDSFKAPFNIQYHSTVSEFSLGFQFTTPDINAKYNSYLKILSTACPYDNDDGYDKTVDGKYSFTGKLSDGHYPTRYADEGGEHLVGSTSYVDGEGATVTWVWDLTHCRPKKKP